MTLEQTLLSVWQQMLIEEKRVIEIEEVRYPTAKTSTKRLRNVAFEYGNGESAGLNRIRVPALDGPIWPAKASGSCSSAQAVAT